MTLKKIGNTFSPVFHGLKVTGALITITLVHVPIVRKRLLYLKKNLRSQKRKRNEIILPLIMKFSDLHILGSISILYFNRLIQHKSIVWSMLRKKTR